MPATHPPRRARVRRGRTLRRLCWWLRWRPVRLPLTGGGRLPALAALRPDRRRRPLRAGYLAAASRDRGPRDPFASVRLAGYARGRAGLELSRTGWAACWARRWRWNSLRSPGAASSATGGEGYTLSEARRRRDRNRRQPARPAALYGAFALLRQPADPQARLRGSPRREFAADRRGASWTTGTTSTAPWSAATRARRCGSGSCCRDTGIARLPRLRPGLRVGRDKRRRAEQM
jgi:hypothetical protein